MKNFYGQHGWQEFNTNRKDILSEFDRILELTKNRPIKVAHGNGVEASLRKWLGEFLPKKYGVTSGYIIPDLYGDNIKIYHYDIIIFNQLDSPILWTEGNEDQSEQGKYRAIPAKHVMAVYEVKSRLNVKNITEALSKLSETNDFKEQLHPFYSCGVIFIDLKESENNNESIIKELMKGKDIIGFNGGMVLRYEGDNSCVGQVKLFNSDLNFEDNYKRYKPIAKPIDDLNIYKGEDGNLTISEQGCGIRLTSLGQNNFAVSKSYGISYYEGSKSVHLNWSRNNFSDFCINLLSSLEGLSFNDEKRPSFGSVFDNIELKKAPLQSIDLESDKPFLEIKLYQSSNFLDNLIDSFNSNQTVAEFKIAIKNSGEIEAVFSDDFFKNKLNLPKGATAVKELKYNINFKKREKELKKQLKKEPILIPYRLVYYPVNSEKNYCSIEKLIRITESGIELLNDEENIE